MANIDISPATTAPAEQHATEEDESILRELQEALEANPELRAPTPRPVDAEWQDFDRLVAENPEFGAPVPVASKPIEYYLSKDRWECGHDGEESQTDIERDPFDGTPKTLTNDVKGICDKCMEKWVKLESSSVSGNEDLAGSSCGPAGPPAYDQLSQSIQKVAEDHHGDDHDKSHGLLDVDSTPGKGKAKAKGDISRLSLYDSEADDANPCRESHPLDGRLLSSQPSFSDDDSEEDNAFPRIRARCPMDEHQLMASSPPSTPLHSTAELDPVDERQEAVQLNPQQVQAKGPRGTENRASLPPY
ncbi:hypothetical protein LOZ53_001091 [Ophidiomyces ophidiicola]|nr:hypothetical protein LOZ55_002098 [Ophidiomyces ophidiicola]KAI1987980.1 hypothetical protein LOZ54_003386 [Ophidiomyces ophidiicola]KAI1991090.1 hypothetical protein LOZ51_004621 [Ophidiomyces ophidiicola]KAI1996271.1 hypothetical protein LOZ53_001091 [Ophidiomyces ophidiicola]